MNFEELTFTVRVSMVTAPPSAARFSENVEPLMTIIEFGPWEAPSPTTAPPNTAQVLPWESSSVRIDS